MSVQLREQCEDVLGRLCAGSPVGSSASVRVGMSLSAVKRELLLQTLKFTGGNKAKAAEILGLSLKTLYNHLKEE
jgi:DNA-binding NtrC family response regulator